MKRKEAVIRYLALVGRANLYQIATYIVRQFIHSLEQANRIEALGGGVEYEVD